ncbi:MAG: acyl-CoA thioesterase [Flavobacteriales bacterium]|nr:acyl-CoA thioesterase [Flavobacteriales bacterium]MCX7769093.1 acyl-CoA thioesterase [Flavobacteriales bacterium]MDW8410449.1 thioesterase family protein [Flavobacteriales bacterium]
MYSFILQRRVSYAETDRMGYLYYGHYAAYYEAARVEALRAIGIRYRDLEDRHILMPVRRMECRFLAPALYDEMVHISVRIPRLPELRMEFMYELRNEQGKLLNTAFTELVFYDAKLKKPVRAPEELVEKLRPYFTAPENTN